MYHYNMIMVKDGEAAAFLERRGYQKHYETLFLKGWDFYYKPARNGYDRENNNMSMVGAKAQAFPEEGTYPDELSALDYKRALRKESEHIESVILKLKEANFTERAGLLTEYYARNESVRAIKNSPKITIELSDEEKACLSDESIMLDFAEKARRFEECHARNESVRAIKNAQDEMNALPDAERDCLDEEEIMLNREIERMEWDKLFAEAFRYARSNADLSGTVRRLREKQQRIESSNYNMREYRYYRRLFSRLLKYEPCIYFSYRTEEQFHFSLVRSIPLSELRIGDLAMLCSNDVLKICR